MSKARAILIWTALAAALLVPVAIAATSPLLAWRDAIYIVAGFAGLVALALLLLQPLLAKGYLPGLPGRLGRKVHGFVGFGLVASVTVHVVGLWLTSPPDVVDALLLRSPTPFSVWGVIAMWAVFAAALLAASRWRLRLRPLVWARWHTGLAMVVVLSSVAHALLIEGTMGTASKTALCVLVLAAAVRVIIFPHAWPATTRRSATMPAPSLVTRE